MPTATHRWCLSLALAGNIDATPPIPSVGLMLLTAGAVRQAGSLIVRTLCASSDPSEDRPDRGEAWISCLAHDCDQLGPVFIIRPIHEVANRAGGEIGRDHPRRSGALLEPGGNDRVHRREHRGSDIGTVEIGNKIAEHGPPCCMKLGAPTGKRPS